MQNLKNGESQDRFILFICSICDWKKSVKNLIFNIQSAENQTWNKTLKDLSEKSFKILLRTILTKIVFVRCGHVATMWKKCILTNSLWKCNFPHKSMEIRWISAIKQHLFVKIRAFLCFQVNWVLPAVSPVKPEVHPSFVLMSCELVSAFDHPWNISLKFWMLLGSWLCLVIPQSLVLAGQRRAVERASAHTCPLV